MVAIVPRRATSWTLQACGVHARDGTGPLPTRTPSLVGRRVDAFCLAVNPRLPFFFLQEHRP